MNQESSDAAAVAELALAFGLLVRRMRAAAPSAVRDFSWTQKAIIARLYKDGPASNAELARAEGVKPQSMAAAVAELETLKVVERRPHPTDGRRMVIALTPEGIATHTATKDAKRGWLAQAIAQLDDGSRNQLFAAGAIIRKLAES